MKLLHLDSSILGQHSASRELSAAIVTRWLRDVRGLEVTYRDLAANPLPHLSGGSLALADADEAATSAAVMDEFLSADVIVVGAPMYNFGIPSQLKAWIDRVAVAGKTFRYTAQGPQGLAGGKQIIVAATYGGLHPIESGRNFVEPYLRQVFAFLGIDDVEFVSAEGLSVSPEQRVTSLSAARARIDVELPLAA
ncbi:FMN-dependent NADH-azoreductase [Thermomonas carbonis]|uniref:FMN dependent NADH:quinone oxidoreductase n=1 Tax=Thermomonas carbonis TaxID=1463158 RepID=A0A7G9SN92_9GAMM|nr:NAD(P)H-dependent oxidoreductase [Thermomonas carbonis]QNN69317.1 NAD(P)H-dependent oxidoreductase [Thermomonas carbonis]GHC05291.1 FMN-dependent NADH-azoreductase 2 [Thermomonas carbonis]